MLALDIKSLVNTHISDSLILINGLESMESFIQKSIYGKKLSVYVKDSLIECLKLNKYKLIKIKELIDEELTCLETSLNKVESTENWAEHSDHYYQLVQSIKYYASVQCCIEHIVGNQQES